MLCVVEFVLRCDVELAQETGRADVQHIHEVDTLSAIATSSCSVFIVVVIMSVSIPCIVHLVCE